MRYVIICQEQSLLAQGCQMAMDGCPILYLVDTRSLQRKLSKVGYQALSGDFRQPRLYQRAHIEPDDQFLIQVGSACLTADITHQLTQIQELPSITVITDHDDAIAALPPTVKRVSVAQLLCQASIAGLRRARNHQMVQQLRNALANVKNLLILMQHDPDPDAIASGLALRAILGRKRTTAPLGSFGHVTRPENVTMVKLLDVTIEHITPDMLQAYDGIAMVDVQPPYFNATLPKVDAVVDHHPKVASYAAQYCDVRTHYGSTATIFVQYLQATNTRVTQRLATALYYGLKTDTLFLGRETTEADVEAFSYLYPRANHNLIRRMEHPKLPLRDLDAFGYALRARTIIGSTFFTHLGMVEREDVLSQFAEFCLQVEEIERSVVSGIFKGNLVVSVRTAAHGKSAGELVRHAFGHLGSAGGHRCMAKAVIPLARLEQEFGRLSDADLGEVLQDQIMQYLGMSVTV
jgi:nanoRNase/pAp phosphatase (c-di-AMP/oligoRNAs hydrolase)